VLRDEDELHVASPRKEGRPRLYSLRMVDFLKKLQFDSIGHLAGYPCRSFRRQASYALSLSVPRTVALQKNLREEAANGFDKNWKVDKLIDKLISIL
jgi:hypothetical protein